MLEALLATGKKGTALAGTGPGPQTLIGGDANLGFFGEVTSAQLFTTDQLATLANFTGGTTIIANPVWLKFAYKNKILFIAKTAIRNFVNWNMLYYAGLVYGTDDAGVFRPYASSLGVSDTGCEVPQLNIVDKSDGTSSWGFIVRLVQMSTTASETAGNGSSDASVKDVEWNDLMYSVAAATRLPVRNGRYFNYADAVFYTAAGTGSTTIGKEQISGNISNFTGRGPNLEVVSWTSSIGTLAVLGWRPVLELIRPDQGLINPTGVRWSGPSLLPVSLSGVLNAPDFLWTISGTNYTTDGVKAVGGIRSVLLQGLLVSGSAVAVVGDAVVGVQTPSYKTDSPLPVGGLKSLMLQADSLYTVYTITNVVTN